MPVNSHQVTILSLLKRKCQTNDRGGVPVLEEKPYKTHIEEEREKADMGRVIAQIISQLVSVSEKQKNIHPILTPFDAPGKPPAISIKKYMERIVKYASCPLPCYPVALYYLDQLKQKASCPITSLNVQRLLILSITMAAKMFDDNFYSNKYYATIGGLSLSELNQLELTFLDCVDFDLSITQTAYLNYFNEIRNNCLMTKQMNLLGEAFSRMGMLNIVRRSSMPGVEKGKEMYSQFLKRSCSQDLVQTKAQALVPQFRQRSYSLCIDRPLRQKESVLYC